MNKIDVEDITDGTVDFTFSVLIYRTEVSKNGKRNTELLDYRQENVVNPKDLAAKGLMTYDIVAQMTHKEIPLSEYFFSNKGGGCKNMKVVPYIYQEYMFEEGIQLFKYELTFIDGSKVIYFPYLWINM